MERPSLIPALSGLVAYATTLEIGPHATSLILSLANIAAATVLAIIGQRIKASIIAKHAKPIRRKQKPRRPTIKA